MITGLLLTSHCWRRVSPWRCAAAVVLWIGADVLVGIAMAALLGAWNGSARFQGKEAAHGDQG